LGDQNLVLDLFVLCVVFGLQGSLCFGFVLFCKMYGTWIPTIVLGSVFLSKQVELWV
jgi:hypothetical protein